MPDAYTYTGQTGLAAGLTSAELAAEMADLDMPPGTHCIAIGTDDDRGLTLLEWVDASGNNRLTSVTPDDLTRLFTRG
jgi:hypothetical protein